MQQENIERLRCDIIIVFSSMARQAASGSRLPMCSAFAITLRHTTLGRTPLDEWSARRRDRYLSHITQNTQKRQTSKPQEVFEPVIQACERRPTRLTATPLGSAQRLVSYQCVNYFFTKLLFQVQNSFTYSLSYSYLLWQLISKPTIQTRGAH